MKSAINAGDTVIIRGNSIFRFMGLHKVQGEVMLVNSDSVAFKCKQTGAIETAERTDGEWTVLSARALASICSEAAA